MPRLNAHGQAVMGVGRYPASVDGRPLAPIGGAASWFDVDTIIYAAESPDGMQAWLEFASVASGSRSRIAGTPGANELAAGGGGRWCAWRAGVGVYGAYTDAKMGLAPTTTDGRGAAAPDGTIAVCLDRQADGPLELRHPDGRTVSLPHVYGLQLLSIGQAIWNAPGGGLGSMGLPGLGTLPGAAWARVAWLGDGLWVVYPRPVDGALIAHPAGALDQARVLATGPNFYHDVVAIGGTLIAAYSTTQGERPQDLVKVLDVAALPVINLAPPPVVSVPPLQTSAIPAIQAHPRKLWMAPFFSFGRYGDTPIADYSYGNAITLTGDERDSAIIKGELQRVYPKGFPLIVWAGQLQAVDVQPYIGNVIAWWCTGATAAALSLQVIRAAGQLPEKPIVAYLDAGDVTDWPAARPPWITDRVWPGVQAYRRAGESIAAMRDRLEAVLTRLASWNVYAVLTPRFDDVNGTQPVSFTLEAMPLYADLIQRFPICGVMPFADRRGTGIANVPELRAWADALQLANPARPGRFDYWTPAEASITDVLKNKLQQSVEMVALSAKEKAYLLGKIA